MSKLIRMTLAAIGETSMNIFMGVGVLVVSLPIAIHMYVDTGSVRGLYREFGNARISDFYPMTLRIYREGGDECHGE